MEIRANEPGHRLELIPNDEADPATDYTIRAEVRTRFGAFAGENSAVHISDFRAMPERLARFLDTRDGDLTVEMTEGCRLRFFRWNHQGDVGVQFTICRFAFGGNPADTTMVLTGGFRLDAQYLNELRAELTRLAG